jgi:hypothetical protein
MSEEATKQSEPSASSRRSAWGWPVAGLMAGAMVGGLDTLWATARGVGGLAPAKGVVLVTLGLTWGGLAGLLVGLAVAATAAVMARVASSNSSRRLASLPEATVALVATPWIGYVAYAAFTGHRAAALAGRSALSVGLTVGGVATMFFLGRAFRRFAARLFVERPAPAARWVVVGTLVGTALASEVANQLVLPRLYPWFHAALAVVTGSPGRRQTPPSARAGRCWPSA